MKGHLCDREGCDSNTPEGFAGMWRRVEIYEMDATHGTVPASTFDLCDECRRTLDAWIEDNERLTGEGGA